MQAITSKAPAATVRERAARSALELDVESVGGVDAERRVAAGEAVDLVVLAAGAIARLTTAGHLLAEPQSLVLATEAVVAVAADAPRPDVTTPDALREVVTRTSSVGVSTGPSGDAVRAILDRWGLSDRAVVAPPGVPVGSLLVERRVDLAVQQRTELEGMDGVAIVGPLPGDLALTSRFVGAVTTVAADPEAARAALAAIADNPAIDPSPGNPASPGSPGNWV